MSTGAIWALIGLCAVVTAAIKAAGPVALGGRELPPWFNGVITLMAPALLAALDDPVGGYAERALALLAPFTPVEVDRVVAERVVPALLYGGH